jgi:hypothetical protein
VLHAMMRATRQAARLGVLVYACGLAEGATEPGPPAPLLLGWVNIALVDERGQMASGLYTLPLWPLDEPFSPESAPAPATAVQRSSPGELVVGSEVPADVLYGSSGANFSAPSASLARVAVEICAYPAPVVAAGRVRAACGAEHRRRRLLVGARAQRSIHCPCLCS